MAGNAPYLTPPPHLILSHEITSASPLIFSYRRVASRRRGTRSEKVCVSFALRALPGDPTCYLQRARPTELLRFQDTISPAQRSNGACPFWFTRVSHALTWYNLPFDLEIFLIFEV